MGTQNEPDWKRILTLRRQSAMPLYYQVYEALQGALGQIEPHVQLPTEEKLIDYAGVSRATIRKAISELTAQGLIYTVQGRGTYAADPRVVTNLRRPVGFTESIAELGYHPSTEVLSVRKEEARGQIADLLGASVGSSLTVIERIRSINGKPSMLEVSRLPSALVPGLESHDLSGSLYKILLDTYGLAPETGSETIMAVIASQNIADYLAVHSGAPLLATIRTTITADGAPLEYTLRYARGDLCTFRVSLENGSHLSARRPGEAVELENVRRQ